MFYWHHFSYSHKKNNYQKSRKICKSHFNSTHSIQHLFHSLQNTHTNLNIHIHFLLFTGGKTPSGQLFNIIRCLSWDLTRSQTCKAHYTSCMRPANESRRYNVTSSLIGWAHTRNFTATGKLQTLISGFRKLDEILWWDFMTLKCPPVISRNHSHSG